MNRGSSQDLFIDRVTPLARPSVEQIRTWASGQRVFISSTMVDLSDIRREVARAVGDMGAEAVMFESFGARSDDSRQAYTDEVRRSTIYLGIFSRLYGPKLKSGYSATQEEYEEALEHRKEILLFLDDSIQESQRDGNLNRWVKDLYQFHVLSKYRSSNDLIGLVRTSLEQLAANQLTPWVKLGQVIFQATRIARTTHGKSNTITVTTASQDPRITSLLRRMSTERFATPGLRLTYGRESVAVNVEGLEEVIDPAGISLLTLNCKILDKQQQSQKKPSFLLFPGGYQSSSGSYTHKDLVRIALHSLVIGEEPPKDRMFASTPRLDFKALYSQYGDDGQLFVKILQLLTIEAIYEHDIVESVISFSIGRVRKGNVHVALTALLPKLYTNVEAEQVSVEGDVNVV